MTIRARTPMSLLLLSVLAALLLTTAPAASAAPLIGKDGKIHACYKWKGKGKGTLRVVRSAKVRCPKKWKKVSWYVKGPFSIPIGAPGPAGPQGEQGPAGVADDAVVKQLEGKVSELLTRVEELEALVPTVQTLCTQMETVTGQVNSVLGSVAGLNSLLDTLLVVFDPVGLPTALPSFNCPTS